jgi:NAD(P)-dependent dehydrogenase (short-subunit alcohol dehydrogenase family)
MKDLAGRVAVVTGAASGVGRALADGFAAQGMKVVLADVEEGPLSQAVSEINASGAEAIGVRTDVSREEDVQALADRTIEAFGGVHVVCNNAGVTTVSSLDSPLSAWQWVIGVNLWGVIYGCRIFLPLIREQGEGHIVNTGSMASLAAGGDQAYVVSKWGVLGLSEAIDGELRKNGEDIGVSLLIPISARTNFLKAERNRPSDVPSVDDNPSRQAANVIYEQWQRERGDNPEDLAPLVIDAIHERRFFICSRPELPQGAVQRRLQWLETGAPPA